MTARKRRKGRERGTRSGKETETVIATARGIANGRGRKRGSVRGVEMSVKIAADRERGLEKIKNETERKMRRTSTNAGDLRGGSETRRPPTKNG